MKSETRPYSQRVRAEQSAANTERILGAALETFVERPFDQVTLAAVAQRAGVGLQTVIRRVGTKDGLVEAVASWVGPQVAEDLGPPTSDDPPTVVEALSRHYERWGAVTHRTLQQEDVSPALADFAARGRRAHRAWLRQAFAAHLTPLSRDEGRRLLSRLAGVTGVELWLVLRRDEGLSVHETREAITDLVDCCLAAARPR